MKVKIYGTRGSIPVSSPQQIVYGGNTTCVQIMSDCIPSDTVFVIDGGSGIRQCSADNVVNRKKMVIAFTHYHQDHLVGIPMAAHFHVPSAHITVYGPEQNGWGPQEALQWLFMKPVFPVEFEQLRDRVKCRPPFGSPGNQVLVIHSRAGFHLLKMSRYKTALRDGSQIKLGDQRHDINECLIVSMHKTEHPDYSISYRFEEKPTGRVFVFLTDHEKTAGFSKDLLVHVHGAHLLLQDGQYTEEVYVQRTAGFGHGTPRYCVDLAILGEVEKLLITHHDPGDTDSDVDKKVDDAQRYATDTIASKVLRNIGAARDYMEVEI